MKQLCSFRWFFPALGLLAVVLLVHSAVAAAIEPDNSITAVWQRVLDVGAYNFTADVEQTLIPRPIPSMIGQTDERVDMRLEGEVMLPDYTRLRLQLEGAGLNTSSVELVQNGAETYLLKGEERIPVQNPMNLSAPTANYLSYLAAAENVQPCDSADLPSENPQPCYTYQINGARFAKVVRDQMQAQLQASQPPLPPGMTLSSSSLLQRLSGRGQLWLDSNGLPLRQVLDLELPAVNEEYDAQIHVVMDLSFGEQRLEQSSRLPAATPWMGLDSPADIAPTGLLLFFLLAVVSLLLQHRRLRWLYGLFAVGMSILFVLTPLLQAAGVVRFQEHQAQAAPAETIAQALDLSASMAPETRNTRFAESDGRSAQAEPALTCGDGDPGADEDEDGLSDADELCLGTDPEHEDSDRDVLTDTLEIDGFDYGGRHWTSNPFQPDSNHDGLSDVAEWPEPVGAAPNLEGVDDWDPDGDGVPNLWDADNDGDHVPDNLDLSPFSRTAYSSTFSLATQGGDFDGYQYIEIQVQPEDETHLRYSTGALDWPYDELAQIQDLDDSTEDIRLFPMLRIRANGAPNQELARKYGVSAFEEDDGSYTLYAPVSPVGDGGRMVAFYAKVAYGPDELDDIRWGEVELVWTVQMSLDKKVGGEVVTSIIPMGIQAEDSFRVAGLKITKSHNYQSAVIGTPDTPDEDRWLFNVLFGLSNTFLTHQDPDLQEIEHRFNSANTDIEQTWGVPAGRVVVDLPANPYGHNDEGTADISVRIRNYLDDHNYPLDEYPSLILAIQEEVGLYGLDDEGQYEPGPEFSLNLANVAMSTRRSLKSNTYQYEDSEWETLELEATLDIVQERYKDELSEILDDLEEDYPDLTEDDLKLLLDMFYTAWFFGQTRLIQTDGRTLAPEAQDDGDVYDEFSHDVDSLPAYLLEATHLGENGGGLRIGDNQTQTWQYMREQEENETGFFDSAWAAGGKGTIGVVKMALAMRSVAQAIKFAELGGGYGGMMRIFSDNAGAGARKLGAAGAVLGVAFIWAAFGLTTDFSDPLAVKQTVAYAVVATVITVALFIISLNPIGAMLVALFSFIDLIFMAAYAGQNSLTEIVVKAIAEFFYSVDMLTTFEDVDFVDFDTEVMDEDIGIVVGNRFRVTDECVGVIERTSEGENDDLEDSWITCAYHGSATGAAPVNQNGGRNCSRSGSTLTCTDSVGVEYYLDTAKRNVKLVVKSSIEAKTYYQECYVGGIKCERSAEHTHLPDDLPEEDQWEPMEFYLDVLPANFLDLWTWSEIINPDPDGDGLDGDEEDSLGADPHNWDSDGDGLSDGFEYDNQEDLGCDPLTADTDGDGLSDGDEYRIGTEINAQDSDDDGLTDGEEFFHQDGGDWVGGWLVDLPGRTAYVYSDPLVADADGDGMNDRSERNQVTSPYGYNDAPRLTLAGDPLAESPDGSVSVYVDLNDTVTLTLTLENSGPHAVTDTLTLCLPAFLTNLQGGVMQGDRHPPSSSAGSCNGLQWSFANPNALQVDEIVSTTVSAQVSGLVASASGEISATLPYRIGDELEQVVDQVAVAADLDDPAVSLAKPADGALLGGGISNYVLGGSASDDDSWVSAVQVNLPGLGWTDAENISPWAYTWELPADGEYSLQARSIDYLGHIGLSATAVVTVDNTAPEVTLDLAEGEVLTGESGRVITVTLTGDASDNLSGLMRVQVSTDGRPWQEVWAAQGANLTYTAWSREWTLPNEESAQGEHTVAVRAWDRAGNQSEVLKRTIIVDVAPPTSELTDRTYLNDPAPHVSTNQPLDLFGVANDAGNAPLPAQPVELVGELDGLDDATIWLELSSVDDDDDGVSVTWLGDFNGDRLSDLAIGLPAAEGGKGQVAVVYGRAGDWPVPADVEILADSPTSFVGASGADLGKVLSAAGDVNGDGFDDLLIGDPHNDRVYLVFGQAASLGSDLELNGPRAAYWSELVAPAGEQIGQWLSAAGDVNGDGFDDLLIGVTGAAGKTYLLLGEPAPWWETVELDVKAAAEIATNASGAHLNGVGDMDGDAYDEFAISEGNTVYLFEGRDSFAPMAGESLTLDDAITAFASLDSRPAMAALGNVDGDTYDLTDFVYANGNSPTLVLGDVNRDWDTQTLSFSPAASGFLAAPGDVDVDGRADILLGNADGDAYLVLGDDLANVEATLTSVQAAASTRYAAGADLNSDGSSDLLLVSSKSTMRTAVDYGSLPHVNPGDLPLVRGYRPDNLQSARLAAAPLADRYVNDDGTCEGGTPCYTDIQAAVDAAASGETIKVEPGVYGSFTVDNKDNLTISGVYADVVFVDGGGGTFAARIQHATGVKLEDMTLRNADEIVYLDDAGVGGHQNPADKIVLDTVLIYDFISHAVTMDRTSALELTRCTLAGGDNHFELYGAPDPAADANWSTVSTDGRTATDARGGLLTNGQLLYFLDDSSQIDVFNPDSTNWSTLPIPPEGYNAGMTADENGHLWALRGDPLGGFDGTVYAIAYVSADEIYVGGAFHHVGDVALDYIAKWDGSGWVAVGAGGDAPNGTVRAITVEGNELFAGGSFGLRYLPDRVHPSGWQNWGEITGGGEVETIAAHKGDVYVGGSFTEIGGIAAQRIAKRDTTGTWKLLGYQATNSCNGVIRGRRVSDMVIKGGYLYLGGQFATAAHNPGSGYCGTGCAANVARLDLSTDRFGSITDCDNMLDRGEMVLALEFSGDDLLVGGAFTCVDMEHGNGWSRCYREADNLAILKPDGSWSLPDFLKANNWVDEIQVDGSSLYIGGSFSKVGGSTSVSNVALYDDFPNTGATWQSLDGGMHLELRAMVYQDGNLYAGGRFIEAGGNRAYRFSRWDGSSWTAQSFYRYDGAWQARSGPWTRLGAGSAVVSAGDGILYAVPGGGSADLLRYTVGSDSWAGRADLPAGVGAGASLAWADGYLYVLRGGDSGSFYRYNPRRNSWKTLEPVTDTVVIGSGASLVWDGHNWLYILAGGNGTQLQRYRIPDGRWEVLDAAPAAVNAGGGLARVGENLYGVPGGDTELWSYDPIAQYLEKLTLDQVAIVAPENASAATWINLDSVIIPPDDFVVGGADSTWVGGDATAWSPEPQLAGSDQISHDKARFLDAGHSVYRVDAGSLLEGGYHRYRSEIVYDEDIQQWETPTIQQGMYTGANRVRLKTGVFEESIHLVSGVEVVGNGADLTILQPRAGDTEPALVRAEGVVGAELSMLTLHGNGSGVDGLAAEDGAQAVTLRRTIIRDMDTAISITGGDTELEVANNTVISNTDGLVASSCAPVNVRNTIFADHTGSGLTYDGCATRKLHKYNLFWDNGVDIDPADPGPGELFLDPLFVDPGPPTHDYHTEHGSPVIDAGDPGDLPPPGAGGRVDIGYTEQNRAALYVDDDYCQTCLNDGLSWQVDAFDVIQDALDTAADNLRALKAPAYTVGVGPGAYTETLDIPSYVRLVGSGAEESIIVADSASSVVSFDGVVQSEIEGFYLQAEPNTTAITVTGAANNILISRNIIETTNSAAGYSAVAFGNRATGRVEFNTLIDLYDEGGDTGITSSGVGAWVAVENNILSGGLNTISSGCDYFDDGHSIGLRTLSFGQIFNDYNLVHARIQYQDDANTGLSQGPHDLIYTGPCFEYHTYRIEPASKARDAASPYAEAPAGGGERADMGFYELTAPPLPLFLGREDLSSAMGNSGMDQVEVGLSQVNDPSSPVTDTLPGAWLPVTLDSPEETVSYWQTTVTPTQESLYRFYSRATDLVGNEEENEDVWYEGTFVADSVSPVVTWTQPISGSLVTSMLELRAEVYDYAAGEFSVDDVYFMVDGAEYAAEWAADPWDEDSQEPRTFRAWVSLSTQAYSNVYAVAVDRTGNQGQSGSIAFTITSQAAAESIAPVLVVTDPADGSWFTHTVVFSGTVADNVGGSGVAAVEVSLDGGYTWRAATVDGVNWQLAWEAPDEQEFVSYPTRVRARDQAGNIATDARTFSIDNQPPVGPYVEDFVAILGPLDAEAPPGTHFDFPVFLRTTWRAPVDGSGYATSLIAVDQVSNTLPVVNVGAALSHTHFLALPGDWYVHLAVQDLLGNQFIRHYGPWHVGTIADLTTAFADRVQTIIVDGQIDVELAADVALGEWHDFGWEWGIFEFMDDFEPSPEFLDWWDRQNLFTTWDGDNLYLGYQGAWWDIDGDLWAYVGTQTGGSTLPVAPMSSTLPFAADYAIHVGGAEAATLWTWNGATWESSPFPGDFAQGEGGDTELRLPLAMDAINELALIVFALDEEGNPWSVFPTTNSLGGSWTDLYQWDNLSGTLTTTLESLIGQSVLVELDSPQAPLGVWGPGDQIEYVLSLTNREAYTLTGQLLMFDVSPGIEYQAVAGSVLSDTWEFALPDLLPGAHHVVTVTADLLSNLCSLVTDQVSISVTMTGLPPVQLDLSHRIDCKAPTVTLPGRPEVACWQQAVYGAASDSDGAGVALVEYRPLGSTKWLTAGGTLFWAAAMPLTVTDTWQIEVRAQDWYSHTSEVALVEVAVAQVTDLALVKNITPSTAEPGQTVTYTLTFANQGGCMGREVIVSDTMPVSLTVTSVISAGVTITETGSDYVWQVQDLAPNQGGAITITAVLSDTLADGLILTNTAGITAGTADSDTGNNHGFASVTIESVQITDLALVKDITPSTAEPGQIVTYTLTFANQGSYIAREVIISDTMPVSLTVTSVISAGVIITETGSDYVWQVQDLAPNQGGAITITAVLSDTLVDGQVLTNTAGITAGTADSDTGNNHGFASVTIIDMLHHIYLPLVLKD